MAAPAMAAPAMAAPAMAAPAMAAPAMAAGGPVPPVPRGIPLDPSQQMPAMGIPLPVSQQTPAPGEVVTVGEPVLQGVPAALERQLIAYRPRPDGAPAPAIYQAPPTRVPPMPAYYASQPSTPSAPEWRGVSGMRGRLNDAYAVAADGQAAYQGGGGLAAEDMVALLQTSSGWAGVASAQPPWWASNATRDASREIDDVDVEIDADAMGLERAGDMVRCRTTRGHAGMAVGRHRWHPQLLARAGDLPNAFRWSTDIEFALVAEQDRPAGVVTARDLRDLSVMAWQLDTVDNGNQGAEVTCELRGPGKNAIGEPLRFNFKKNACASCAALLRDHSFFLCGPPRAAAASETDGKALKVAGLSGGAPDELYLHPEMQEAKMSDAGRDKLQLILKLFTDQLRNRAASLLGGRAPGAELPRRFCRFASYGPPVTLDAAKTGLDKPLTLSVLPSDRERGAAAAHGTMLSACPVPATASTTIAAGTCPLLPPSEPAVPPHFPCDEELPKLVCAGMLGFPAKCISPMPKSYPGGGFELKLRLGTDDDDDTGEHNRVKECMDHKGCVKGQGAHQMPVRRTEVGGKVGGGELFIFSYVGGMKNPSSRLSLLCTSDNPEAVTLELDAAHVNGQEGAGGVADLDQQSGAFDASGDGWPSRASVGYVVSVKQGAPSLAGYVGAVVAPVSCTAESDDHSDHETRSFSVVVPTPCDGQKVPVATGAEAIGPPGDGFVAFAEDCSAPPPGSKPAAHTPGPARHGGGGAVDEEQRSGSSEPPPRMMRPDTRDMRQLPDAMPFHPAGVYPEHRPGEYEHTMPPSYQPFYPSKSPPKDAGDTCIPVKDLPIIRTQGPSKYLDDYCIPMRMVQFYQPDVWRMPDSMYGAAARMPSATAQPTNSPKAAAAQMHDDGKPGEGGSKGTRETEQQFVRRFFQANPAPPPMFSLPLPFSGSPKFPAFSSPDGKGAPPPDVPPPPPVTYPLGHLPRKVPALPMPELPAPQWPYG